MALLPALPTAPSFTGISLSPKTNAKDRVFTDGTFKDYVFHVVSPNENKPHGVTSIDKTVDRKLQIIDRPLIEGADVKDWGRHARKFSAEIVFFGPNYLNEFAQFEQKCNDGAAGKLVLPDQPKAVLAYFQNMSIKSTTNDGESLMVSCTWIEASSTDTPFQPDSVLSALDAQIAKANSANISVAQGIQNVLNAVNQNKFLRILEQSRTLARQVQVFVVSALNYPAAVKARVLQIKADLIATVAIAGEIGNTITTFLFGKKNPASTNNASDDVSTTIDPVTGQQVGDFAEPDNVTEVTDPLAPPPAVAEVSKVLPEINTDQSAYDALIAVIAAIETDLQGLQDSSDGRTQDVLLAGRLLVNSLKEMASAIKPRALVPYMLKTECSLAEVCFFNGITVDQVDQVYRNNTHLDDLMVISAGEVVYL